jgi:hypothetical protein
LAKTKQIWKAYIRPNAVEGNAFPIAVPAKVGARPIKVMLQNRDVCVWFEVDPDATDAHMVLWCIGTGYGEVKGDTLEYFDSVIDSMGYVWHFYR